MYRIPKVPGLDFLLKSNQQHHVSHCFDFKNGYRVPQPPLSGIGRKPLKEESLAFKKSDRDPILLVKLKAMYTQG